MDIVAIPPIWRALYATVNEGSGVRIPDGIAGIRDVDAPCDGFEPAGAPFVYAAGTGDCNTDGHYICAECIHITLRELRRRRDLCEDCGAKLGPGDVCTGRCDQPAPAHAAASVAL